MLNSYFSRCLLVVWFVLPSLALAQNSTSAQEAFQQATALLTSGTAEEAEAALEKVTQDFPTFAPAWGTLGNLLRRAQKYDLSLAAFSKANELNPSPAGLFNVGLSYAFLNDREAAFSWLFLAKESKAVLMANLDGSAAASNLRDDPRYASLFPTEAEFASPFVEEVEILQDWFGENRSDTFGWIARNIGDVDGDGLNDVTTSSPGFNGGAGKIYVYSSASGKELWSAEGSQPGGRLGHGIEAAGDVNADGTPDVVASAPYANVVNVYSGIDGALLFSVAGADSSGAFGLSVKGIGDVDDDGYSDILIGEPFQVWGAPINGGSLDHPGRVHIVSGKDQSTLFVASGEAPGDAFGSSVSGKSVDGGYLFIAGAPTAGSHNVGKAYVYSDLTGAPLFTAEPDSAGSQYGSMFLSVVGDLNADGTQDIYISDWGDNATAQGAGKVYLYSGLDGSRLFSLQGEAAADGFGIGISDAGDVNQDGYDDLVVGAWQHASAAPSGGKLTIHSGKDGSLLYSITGKVPGETLGFDTTGMGDVNGDGIPDFLVTSAYSVKNGFQSGRTLIISGARPTK